ncbi:MAG: hypothetical protein GPOALKHO_000995 [Sodalis sp.]|uniref:hypothetical protein n=1 Tax=Sodalis sp. (in: enterobacteria) TaxID=1898979 RepID=UPI003872F0CC|nr:MAG: hypothetical protein GPOALKHO_000995 [Sodalis sp.]
MSVGAQLITLFGKGETALRAPAQLIQTDILAGFTDAFQHRLMMSGFDKAQRFKAASAFGIVLQEKASTLTWSNRMGTTDS